jgi:hypothetical protein
MQKSKIQTKSQKLASRRKIWERIVPLSKTTRDWDIQFWQAQKPEARFRAAWSLVVDFYRIRGRKIDANTFRLQRASEYLKQA